jgi:hypothetical protein
MMRSTVAAAVVAVVLAVAVAAEASELKVGYYDKSCPGVENVVKWHVARALKADRKTGAALVRLIFHDCFVRVRSLHRRPRFFSPSLRPLCY